jgi:polar amino acid transport system permease protein
MSSSNKHILSFIAALLIFGLLIFGVILLYPARDTFNIMPILEYRSIIFSGWLYTILISILALFVSVILGFVLYLMTVSNMLVIRYLGSIFNEIIFGSPLIVFMMVAYFLIAFPLGFQNRLLVGIMGLSVYMAPYMKNLFEGAMKTIDPLQYQAMTVFGFTTYQKYRYIIIPQLIRVIIPPLIGNLTFIVKGSSLLNFIGVPELYNQVSAAQYNSYRAVEGFLIMLVLYLMITIPLIRITKFLEKKVESWN